MKHHKLHDIGLVVDGVSLGLTASTMAAANPVLPPMPHAPGPSEPPIASPSSLAGRGPLWWRGLWVAGGVFSLLLGFAGVFLPLLPTVPFVLLAGYCFARGSRRAEAWLLNHPSLGPMVKDWRANRTLPMRVKCLAWTMMALGSLWALWLLPSPWCWLPALACLAVGGWMWKLPTRQER